MHLAVIRKASSETQQISDTSRVTLDAPSVIRLQAGPEQIAGYQRDGDDLVITLNDGSVLRIDNFFVMIEGERSDLVFEDASDVDWWAQYDDTSDGFAFAEIEQQGASMPWLPGLLATGLGAGAAAASGGDSGSAAMENDPPEGAAQPVTTPEDTPVDGVVTGSDVDGDELSYTLSGDPEHGTVTVNPDGSYSYVPDEDYTGEDSFEVTVSDGNGGTDTVTVPVTVTPVNDPPVGEAELVTTPEDTPVDGVVTGSDVDGDDLTYTLNGDPEHGTVTVNPDGSYSYVPDEDYTGEDSFEVTVSDGNGGTDTVTVPVTVTPVNDPPVGEAELVTTPEDTPVDGVVTGSDVDGDDLTYTLNGDPEHGTVTVNPDGSYSYVPDEDYTGEDSFEVTVSDGNGGTDTVTVPVTVTPVNDPAAISGEAEGDVIEAGGVENDVPGSPDALGTLAVEDVDEGEAGFQAPDSLEGTYGSFSFDPETGEWSYTLDNDRAATQALTDGETATDQLVVTSRDGTATETIEVTVTGANDVPVVTEGTGAVTEDDDNGTGNLTTSGQLTISDPDAGESGVDADNLAFVGGSHGGAALGAMSVDSDGNWDYSVDNTLEDIQTLAEGESITESWTVPSTDGTADTTITVTINGTNDLPEISGEATGDVAEDGTQIATGTLAQTDIDTSDSHVWTVEGSSGTYGELTVDEETGEWRYELDNSSPEVQALAEDESVLDEITVRVTDSAGGYDEQVVTITITGENDGLTISPGSDLDASVTETADGAAGENAEDHSQTGTITVIDPDGSDTHTVDVTEAGTDYLGTFTTTEVDSDTGQIDWTFTVNDSVLDGLGEGETLTQHYDVTVTDSSGDTATETVEVTLTGTNDQPVTGDEASLIAPGDDAVMDVLANDSDDDDGETAGLTVTSVDGQPIAVGAPVVLSDDRGTVTLNGSGQLTFAPGPGASGEISLPYTVDDGSGAPNATATGNWVINIVGVDITDDASPDDATTPDDVLSSVDELTEVAISGHAAPGGTVTSLVISDGTNEVTVPVDSITVQADGSYTTTADLSGLSDGDLTVTADIEDASGNTATTTDTIFKDTVTTVEIDPVLVVDGEPPTVTGTGEPGAEVTLDVDGSSYTAEVQPDGTWSVTLPGPLGEDDTEISAEAVDEYGNTSTDDRTVTGLTVADAVDGELEDIVVEEAGLPDGSDAGSDTDATASTFTIAPGLSTLSSIVIGGTVSGGTLSGGTELTALQLEGTGTTPVDIPTDYGTLTITGYDAETGVISYTYALSENSDEHSDSVANDRIHESIQIAVVETDGDIRVDSLTAAVEDDAPQVPQDDTAVTVAEGGGAVGSASGGTNLLANDTLGADGGRVHEVGYTDRSGADVSVQIPEGGSETVETQYGELTVESDGTWTYTPLATVEHAQPANDTDLSDDFSYTVIDADGDISAGSATQAITVTDTAPAFRAPEDGTVDEANLATGSNPDAPQTVVDGSLNLSAGQDTLDVKLTTDSAPDGLSSGGDDLRYELSTDGHTLTAYTVNGGDPVFIVTVTDPTSADAGYSFELLGPLDHDGEESLDLTFGTEVTDSDGDTDTTDFSVTIADDAVGATLARTVDEDSEGFTANISADATADNTVIWQNGVELTGDSDGSGGTIYNTANGTVTISADGELDYVPDPQFSGQETYQVRTEDDGTDATVDVTVDVTPVSDAPTIDADAADVGTLEDTAVALGLTAPVVVDDGTGAGNNPTPERIGAITLSGLPEGAELSWGSGSVTVDDSGEVTITLTDPGLTVADATGAISMTSDEFEALEVLPPEHDSDNFDVTYSVTSYEVDGSGNTLPDVPGATSNETVTVHVQAVTDPAAMVFDSTVDAAAVENADEITYGGTGGNTEADIALDEDMSVDLSEMLLTSFDDLDGSELRSITIQNGSGVDIVVNGQTVAAGEGFTVSAPGLGTDASAFPAINIGGTANFSGDLNGITVTLNAQDKDADGYLDGSTVVPGEVDGIAEADTSDNSVTLNLHVAPVADDVAVEGAEGEEDTAIAFLAGVSLTDTSEDASTGGSEVITEVSFEVPAGWTVTAPDDALAGATAGQTGSTYTIAFTAGTEAEREAYLDDFTITPPAHDSSDATLTLDVTAADESIVNGATVTDTTTTQHELVVTVNETPETVGTDTDGDGTDDLTMTPGFEYPSAGTEDAWFDINSDGFDLAAGWSNQDDSEVTYARLTPELINGDGNPEDAIGSRFRWVEDGTAMEAVFDGTAIDVPMSALDTLEFRAADNFSGQFNIRVQAYTVDYDDDGAIGGDDNSETVSGEAFLTNLVVAPQADEVTLSLAARTQGPEDADIPLNIRPTSSDPSETFDVTIDAIPPGAVLTYDGTVLDTSSGSVTLTDFDPQADMTLRPPEDSNDDFTLNVTAQSVDRLETDDGLIEDTSDPISLEMDVEVRGVADAADVTATPQNYVEADLDGGADSVMIADLLAVDRQDNDGSEALTLRVTGLPEGFDLPDGRALTTPEVTGADRVWVLTEAQLATAEITVPENFSGTVDFSVTPVTTENDGSSLTGTSEEVSFSVTPSPEAALTSSATLTEDTIQPLGVGIVHQNGDTDEVLSGLRISVDDADDGNFTLFIGEPGSEVALSESGLNTVTEGGVTYYELTAAQAEQLSAQGSEHLDGDLGGFDLLYQVTDPGDGSVSEVTGDWVAGRFELSATPVTDQPDLSIGGISSDGDAEVTDNTVSVDTAGEKVTVNLNVATPDSDGSEHVVRVLIENVPEGVTVDDAQAMGGGNWLLIYDGADALPVNDAGGIDLPVVFTVGSGAAGVTDEVISMTVQTQDRGDQVTPGTEVLSDSTEWTLNTDFESGDPGNPPSIDAWDYTDQAATEDTSFMLSEMINGQVTAQGTDPSILTITLSDVPPGTSISGMVRTTVDGQEVWTASVTTNPGDDAAAVQAQLGALMDSIVITPAGDGNDNNLGDAFSFDATLTTAVPGGSQSVSENVVPEIPVVPVADPADVSIVLGDTDADGELTETDSEIPLTVTVSNIADGAAGSIENGDLYLQIGGSNGLGEGTLTLDGVEIPSEEITGVEGIPDGTYYVISDTEMGVPSDLVFTPDEMVAGDVTVDAWVRNTETGAAEAVTSEGSATLPVSISNDGVAFTDPAPVTGEEAADTSSDSLIELDLGLDLNDSDGSEQITSVLLSNLPDGFLLYTGDSVGDASAADMSSNAGGTDGLNTWIVASNGESLPAYIGILPPKHWSGTLEDLELTVTSGETELSESRVDVLELDPVTVTPVANGIELTPTNSFGREGTIVPLNLNASMADSVDASQTAAPDASVETVTLELTGLGQYASFYVGGELLTGGVNYDAGTDTYTVEGLSQSDVDALGFRQAANAIADTDATTDGVQVAVTARTVDGADVSADAESTVTLNIGVQQTSTGDDDLLWTGLSIDGRSGDDTVNLRQGESLTGDDLQSSLSNIEVLEMGIAGANSITDLTVEHVLNMTSGSNHLTIAGSAEDNLTLAGDWNDNGDGSYTGTSGGSEVTLVVDGAGVTPPVEGFSVASDEVSAPSLLSFSSTTESFGLVALDADAMPDETEPGSPADSIILEDVLISDADAGSGADALIDQLPEEDSQTPAAAEGGSNETGDWGSSTPDQTLDEELQSNVVYEV
ncbi:VCBS domain-containing protein [Qingshengfaniella alkalisoli]|uniref:Tandem-95 repeat protein n=1 Tax=Qingshengfaniella alkalisoli TaxID=2599296 RepID=A0A5B8IXR0_9RHOB|nr:VCBS domain-containing protein [Qingshengfaniella alkalisoli]QDY69418.1 tandem-95 repeat protein [Qingshengfaniella alkalisoli]